MRGRYENLVASLNFRDSTIFTLTHKSEKSVYLNGFNHPGMNRAAVDKLVDVMERKGITLAGVAADNLAIDTGEGNVGEGDSPEDGLHRECC